MCQDSEPPKVRRWEQRTRTGPRGPSRTHPAESTMCLARSLHPPPLQQDVPSHTVAPACLSPKLHILILTFTRTPLRMRMGLLAFFFTRPDTCSTSFFFSNSFWRFSCSCFSSAHDWCEYGQHQGLYAAGGSCVECLRYWHTHWLGHGRVAASWWPAQASRGMAFAWR